MVVYYVRIVKQLAHVVPCDPLDRKKDGDDQRKWSLIKMLIIVTTLFMLFTWPAFIVMDILAIKQKTFYDISIQNYTSFIFCFMAFPVSTLISVFNPILYIVFDKNIRIEVKKKLRHLRCLAHRHESQNLETADAISAVASIRPTPNKTIDD
ncbi:hypothetical protein TrispH2_008490 [Trichoplax sp. H2]|nr:hypothetical protein TrispH2_008490 [Trichoplax sp. H2]|eukprot:RDD40475.1 hypothetical protein TrispH2_008490 [Trichoplax sp. H2]